MLPPVSARPRAIACLLLITLAASACGSTVQSGSSGAPGVAVRDGSLGDAPLAGSTDPSQGAGIGGIAPGSGAGTIDSAGTANSAVTANAGGARASNTSGTAGGAHGAASVVGGAPKGPIKIGLLDVGNVGGGLAAIGAKTQAQTSGQDLAKAYIHHFNTHGGIAGRQVEYVEYTINVNDDYQTDLQAACARFTQDNHVAVVLSQLGDVSGNTFDACIAKAGVLNLEMSSSTYDAKSYELYATTYSLGGPNVDRRESAVFRGMHEDGVLTAKNTVGIIVEDCPESTAAYSRTLAPMAKQFGLKLVRADVDCLTSFSGVADFESQVQATVLPFRSKGVDRVTFVSAWESLMLLSFENQAGNQGYKPLYAVSSLAGPQAFASQYSSDTLSRLHGVGWLPDTDVVGGLKNAMTASCEAIARDEGIKATDQANIGLVHMVCEQYMLFEAAVKASGGYSDRASLIRGLAAVDGTYTSALMLGNRTTVGRTRDAAALFAPFQYLGTCSCFKYSAAPTRTA